MWFEFDLEKGKQKFSKIKVNNKFWDYNFALPQIDNKFFVSLGEGGTPCRRSKQFGEKLGINNLFF